MISMNFINLLRNSNKTSKLVTNKLDSRNIENWMYYDSDGRKIPEYLFMPPNEFDKSIIVLILEI